MRNRKAQGFTLIELLIVIAIIGILAAVLIPNLLGARRTAVDRAAAAHAQNVYTAVHAQFAEVLNEDPGAIEPACFVLGSDYIPALAANSAAAVDSQYVVSEPSLNIAAGDCQVATDSKLNVQVTLIYGGGNDDFVSVGDVDDADIQNGGTVLVAP